MGRSLGCVENNRCIGRISVLLFVRTITPLSAITPLSVSQITPKRAARDLKRTVAWPVVPAGRLGLQLRRLFN